jgi:hypothetical protein
MDVGRINKGFNIALNKQHIHNLNTNTMTTTAKKTSNYATKVFGSNEAMKQECKTLGYAFRMIINTDGVDADLKKMAKVVQSDKVAYDTFATKVRKNPKGQFVPFYCLQLLYAILPKKETKASVKPASVKPAKVSTKKASGSKSA